jgi:hypothetical protein
LTKRWQGGHVSHARQAQIENQPLSNKELLAHVFNGLEPVFDIKKASKSGFTEVLKPAGVMLCQPESIQTDWTCKSLVPAASAATATTRTAAPSTATTVRATKTTVATTAARTAATTTVAATARAITTATVSATTTAEAAAT